MDQLMEDDAELQVHPRTTVKSFGLETFAYMQTDSLHTALAKVLPEHNVEQVLASALLRILKPQLYFEDFADAYKLSYISEFIPGLNLSDDALLCLVQNLSGCLFPQLRSKFFKALSAAPLSTPVVIAAVRCRTQHDRWGFYLDMNGSAESVPRDGWILYACSLGSPIELVAVQGIWNKKLVVSDFLQFIHQHGFRHPYICCDRKLETINIGSKIWQSDKLKSIKPCIYSEEEYGPLPSYLEGVELPHPDPQGDWRRNFSVMQYSADDFGEHEILGFKVNRIFIKENLDAWHNIYWKSSDNSKINAPLDALHLWLLNRNALELSLFELLQQPFIDYRGHDPSNEGWEFISLIAAIIKQRMYAAFRNSSLYPVWSFEGLCSDLSLVWRHTDVKSPRRMTCDAPCWNFLTADAWYAMEQLHFFSSKK